MTDHSVTKHDESRPFQLRVVDWMMETFSMEACRDTTERNHRFIEESLELGQARGCTAAEAHMLVDYVFGRPVGDPEQEVGGVMVTLAALCAAGDMSMVELGNRELARCWQNIEKIRAKQAGNPRHSPLPGPSAPQTSNPCSVCERSMSLLQLYGVPPQRARNPVNGIEVLMTRLHKEAIAVNATIERLRAAMGEAYALLAYAAPDSELVDDEPKWMKECDAWLDEFAPSKLSALSGDYHG